MNLQIFQAPFFRDETKLRYTRDGRLLIKNNIVEMLNLENEKQLYSVVKKVDLKIGEVEILLTKDKVDNGHCLILSKMGCVRSLNLNRNLAGYNLDCGQYIRYKVSGNRSLDVYLPISTNI